MDEINAALDSLTKEAGTVKKDGSLPKGAGKGTEGADPNGFAAGIRYAVRKIKAAAKKVA